MVFVITPILCLVGTSYVIPVTEFEGKFAVYRTPATHGQLHSEIRVFYPTHHQRNLFLAFSVLFSGLCCASLAVASGVLVEQGYTSSADLLELVAYTNWTLVYWLLGCSILYYGVKFTLILRAHIITTEARRGLPFAAFGLGNLKSRSPARYLFIVLQLTAFAAGLILLQSGLLNGLQTWDKKYLLKSEDVRWYRFLVFMWSIPATLAFSVKFTLIAVHSYRSKDQGPTKSLGQSNIPLCDGGNSLELLTLHLHPGFSSFSETTQALEKGLRELATMNYSDDQRLKDSSHNREVIDSRDEHRKRWLAPLVIPMGPVSNMPIFPPAAVSAAKLGTTCSTFMNDASTKKGVSVSGFVSLSSSPIEPDRNRPLEEL